jgi:hypothetical protein
MNLPIIGKVVSGERHEQRVFAFIVIVEAAILLFCVVILGVAAFFHKASENVEALTALVALPSLLIGSFATLLTARGITNHRENKQKGNQE